MLESPTANSAARDAGRPAGSGVPVRPGPRVRQDARAARQAHRAVARTRREERAGRSRWLGRSLAAAGLLELPWLLVLARTLPATATAAHWPAAWVGLDAMEALGLLATGLLLLRGDSRCSLAAAATATLLLVDAWFDVTTAAPGPAQITALAMAALPELPVCGLCAVLAVRTRPRR